ncbi:MAG TPA: SxtJ family membrane protein [Candidatus Polarisedimenticolaceae bacterium]|nr:SxtJ family membrane protein [Candidatus Polarisedimenticolaceae bacterium]
MALIDVDWNPRARDLRVFALLFLVFAVGAGTVLYFRGDPRALSLALWIAGPVVAVLGLLLPRALRPLYVVMMAIALPIGMVVSTALLIMIYYLMITPIGWAMRLSGHDPMGRRVDPAAESYWVRRRVVDDPKRYFRQY